MSFIDPTREAFGAFRTLPDIGPVHMLNLIRLREQATYLDGRPMTGRDAYAAYGRESGPVFRRLGGQIVWSGDFKLMLIGPRDETWDICFIAAYPSASAFVEMVKDPAYQQAVIHRTAAVADSRLIRMSAKPTGAGFGE